MGQSRDVLNIKKDEIVEVGDEDDPDKMLSVAIECNEEDKESKDDGDDKSEKNNDDTMIDIDCTPSDDKDEEVSHDWMLKGFVSLALWGHIPIPSGKKHKSLLISAVDGSTDNIQRGTRKEARKRKIKRQYRQRVRNVRCQRQIKQLSSKGRLETQK